MVFFKKSIFLSDIEDLQSTEKLEQVIKEN